MIEIRLPSLGADMEEGKLLEWKIQPGDAVKRGQIVAVVDTSKAAVDMEVWQEGTVFELLIEPGDRVPVNTLIATLLEAGESAETATHHPRFQQAAPVTPTMEPQMVSIPAPNVSATRHLVSPAARKHARERGIDIDTVVGSGPNGAVTIDDVEQAAKAHAAPPTTVAAASPADRTREMRRAIATAMGRSKREIPHYYLAETIPMQKSLDWLFHYNAELSITNRVLPAVLLLKAVAITLRDFRDLNGFYQNDEFHPGSGIHLGVAISLRQGGLVAPALHDVDQKKLAPLMQELADLVQRTRANSLRSSELADPTITVTNLGEQGVDAVHGVIYPPQVALVGFGRINQRPWVEDGAITAAPVVIASLAADHRVSDGHRGALFLNALHECLQQPEKLAE